MRQFSETLEHDKCCDGNRHVLPLRYGWNYLLSVRDGRSSDVLLPRLWALTCWTKDEGLLRAVDAGYLSLVEFMDFHPIFQCIDRKHSTPLISSQQAKKKCVYLVKGLCMRPVSDSWGITFCQPCAFSSFVYLCSFSFICHHLLFNEEVKAAFGDWTSLLSSWVQHQPWSQMWFLIGGQ